MYKLLLTVLMFLQLSANCQKKIKLQYGVAITDGRSEQLFKSNGIGAKSGNGLGYYLQLGARTLSSGPYEFYFGVRYGNENSRFVLNDQGKELATRYYFKNHTFSFLFAPGLILNKRQKLFLTLGLVRVFKSEGGGGEVAVGKKDYQYQYGNITSTPCWDFRPGLKWQISMSSAKDRFFELGIEIPLQYYIGRIDLNYNIQYVPRKDHELHYHMTLFYLGFMFGPHKREKHLEEEEE